MQTSDPNYHLPPFPPFACTTRYVPLGSVEAALTRICRSIDADEAISLVIGPPGTGKSLLCGLIASRYRSTHNVVMLGDCQIQDRTEFLRHLLHHLKVDVRGIHERDLPLTLIDCLCSNQTTDGGLLMIVDEAHALSADALEAIRMVTNIMHHGRPRVSAVVCGGVKLDDILVEPSLEAFNQRIATRCYLHPLNREETREYIRETIRNCGADPDVTIEDQAISTIHHACSGFPRLINQLMTQAIDCAAEADQTMITNRIIDEAWSQLQQLPSPMVEQPRIARHASAVEFGELDDSHAWNNAPSNVVSTDEHEEAGHPTFAPNDDIVFDDIVIEGDSEIWWDEVGAVSDQNNAVSVDSSRDLAVGDHSSLGDFHDVSESVETGDDVWADPSVFGEFDFEEEIAIGSRVAPRSQRDQEYSADLEQALHQEIIGLNACMSQLLESETQDDIRLYFDDSDAESPAEVSGSEELMDQFVAIPETGYQQSGDVSYPELSSDQRAISEEANEEFEAASSIVCIGSWPSDVKEEDTPIVRDDSDLLVIEDDVEIWRLDAAKRYDSKDQTISVDFQQMLSRMRNGVT